MDIQKVNHYKSIFDSIAHEIKDDEGNSMEVWYARELQEVLGYARWENFVVAVGRAIESCKSLNVNVDDHFREITKMVNLGSGSHRPIQNFMLTRYACYLITSAWRDRSRVRRKEVRSDVREMLPICYLSCYLSKIETPFI